MHPYLFKNFFPNFSKTFRFIILIVPYLGIFGGDGLMGLGRTALPAIESVTVENENIVQVKSMAPAASYLQKYNVIIW